MKSVDTQWLSKHYWDGMTAKQWTEWAQFLNSESQKVNRKRFSKNCSYKALEEIFFTQNSWLAGKPVGG